MTPAELRERRAALNLSQYRLAQVLGVSTNERQRTSTTISRWETGRRTIPHWVPTLLAELERRLPTAAR